MKNTQFPFKFSLCQSARPRIQNSHLCVVHSVRHTTHAPNCPLTCVCCTVCEWKTIFWTRPFCVCLFPSPVSKVSLFVLPNGRTEENSNKRRRTDVPLPQALGRRTLSSDRGDPTFLFLSLSLCLTHTHFESFGRRVCL